MSRFSWIILCALASLALPSQAVAEPPCDRYPAGQQQKCVRLWKQINKEAEAEMAQFGLKQLQRRQEGQITQEQHVQENMAFIQQSAERRLKLLAERMARD
jgi:hypothetical protein